MKYKIIKYKNNKNIILWNNVQKKTEINKKISLYIGLYLNIYNINILIIWILKNIFHKTI